MLRIAAVLTALMTAGAAAVLPATAASAATPSLGADVGHPQCGSALPAGQAFGVVGVNGGTATTSNPCFAEQLVWARTSVGGSGLPAVSVYVNTADPGPLLASWWPTADRTRRGAKVHDPLGHCAGGATAACAYVYGFSLAADDLQTRGVPSGAAGRWWLDVEVANTWTGTTARNRAVLEGMTARLTAAGQRVGLYALSHEFRDLIGAVPAASPLAKLPSWLAGSGSVAAATRRCTATALAGGRTLLTQVPGSSTQADQDVACRAFTAAPKPRVTGDHGVGDRLTAHAGTWRPGSPHLAYRWYRDGASIQGATGHTHRLVKADAGHRITVTVTATLTGYSRTAATSKAVHAHR